MTNNTKRIVIVGGGISGLSTAYFLSRTLPKAHITILEQTPNLGGWIQSSIHRPQQLPTSFLLESGPRSIRPVGFSGALTLTMLLDLGLGKQLQFVSKSSPSAKNRFVVYKDKTFRLPNSIVTLVQSSYQSSSPLFGILSLIMKELFLSKSPDKLDLDINDTSIGSFLGYRYSSQLVTRLVSAMIHGIYAGDPYTLSVKATMPSLVHAQTKFGSIGFGMLHQQLWTQSSTVNHQQVATLVAQHPELASIWPLVSKSSIYSIRGGLGTCVTALGDYFNASSHVDLRTSVQPTYLDIQPNSVIVHCKDQDPIQADHLVAAIPTPSLHALLTPPNAVLVPDLNRVCQTSLGQLTKTPAVTVAVTSIVFLAKDIPKAVIDRNNGFGLLSPAERGPKTDPLLLGIIFDSWAIPQLCEPEYVKYTVMMGGHMFKTANADIPTMDELSSRALACVRFHLSVPEWIARPVYCRTEIHDQCIPQYRVGHVHQLALARTKVPKHVHLVGSWYSGVGVNDCVKSGFDAACLISQP